MIAVSSLLTIEISLLLLLLTIPDTYCVSPFPELSQLFKNSVVLEKEYSMQDCALRSRTEGRRRCLKRFTPKKSNCLRVRSVVANLLPEFTSSPNAIDLLPFDRLPVRDFSVDTCSRFLAIRSKPEGILQLIPNVLRLVSVSGDVTVPLPLSNLVEVSGSGVWALDQHMRMRVKFNKLQQDERWRVQGACELDYTPIRELREAFRTEVIPRNEIGKLLKKLKLESLRMKKCRMYGYTKLEHDEFEVIFTGAPDAREFRDGSVRVIARKNATSNTSMALLLELQDYSPARLLARVYGAHAVKSARIVRDRNQTIALFLSRRRHSNFTSLVERRGTSRWIHTASGFRAGATLLVTLPFPKRKAIDMKVQLLVDSLEFRLPDRERLDSALFRAAISPTTKIIRMDAKTNRQIDHDGKDTHNKSHDKIMRFCYYIKNNTYVTYAETATSTTPTTTSSIVTRESVALNNSRQQTGASAPGEDFLTKFLGSAADEHADDKLDMFFNDDDNGSQIMSNETANRVGESRHVIQEVPSSGNVSSVPKVDSNESNLDALSIAEKLGLL